MANTLGVCLLSIAFFCCTNLSLARQVPKECSKGPSYWCQNLKQGAECGAVGHCIGTVWAAQKYDIRSNVVSDKFIRLFRQLKDVKDLINEEYLGNRISSECHDVPYAPMASICKENTADLQKYLHHVLLSKTTPEGMCQLIGMCNSDKLDGYVNVHIKKKAEVQKPDNKKPLLVGANHCTWGPSYWCNNFTTFRECPSQHCVERVWPLMTFSEDDDSICQICTDMVKQARQLTRKNNLTEVLEDSCRSIPIEVVSGECSEIANNAQGEMERMLSSEMNPQAICSVVGLCNSARIDNLLLEQSVKPVPKKEKKLLGHIMCTRGPSYWCSNFTTTRECSATKYCANSVWSTTDYPQDNDSICKICTDMVAQARDQLESNETQEELKEVFEGSCKLIPIKIVAKECIKMADDFVPELVETLASQMNPQAVCSVAGLCNSARLDRLLEGYNTQLEKVVSCNNCQQTVSVARRKFDDTSYEDFLLSLLQVCRNMDTLSDSCSMLVFQYYENILEAVKKDLTPQSVCHASGQCTYRFHSHDLYSFPEFEAKPNDDVPCEFCEQLVKHLRDTLVANTTELEFYKVLQGLCKQTGKFKTECLHIAEQYYPIIYKLLVSDLQPDKVCNLMGLCGKPTDTPIAPLIPKELTIKPLPSASKLIGADEANSYKPSAAPAAPKQASVRIVDSEPLPPLTLDRMFVRMPESKAVCSFCEYFLHYMQVELSDSRTEDMIREAVDKACDRLPESINDQCRTFVSQYGPAVIALFVQEIDPSSVCPALGLCPQTQEVRRVSINSEKSNCPLCLFAVEQLETMLKNNRTEENIRHALDNLCNHLSAKLKTECVDFVDAYTNQLVEMLVANMNAQEVCVYLKLCTDSLNDPLQLTAPRIDQLHASPQLMADRNNRKKPLLPQHMLVDAGDIETNEIPDHTVNGQSVTKVSQKTVCVVCEFVMKEIDEQIKDKHNEDEIKKVVHGVCRHMPKSVRGECDKFVEKYADLVINLLAQELEPDQVCEELKLCDHNVEGLQAFREEILDCAVCETVVMAVKKVLNNDKVDRNIVHIVEKSCALLPAKYNNRCHTMMEIYGDSVIHLIEELGAKGVCHKIGLCSVSDAAYVRMHKN